MAAKTDVSTYIFNHTMFRIKDPKVSIPFYEKVLGMECFRQSDGPDFTNYFLGYPSGFGDKASASKDVKGDLFTGREGVLELCHNHGTESDPSFKGYVSGNEEPGRGFGHICISVDDLDAACQRFTELGVKFKKRPEEGRMRHIAFIYDPDGYWIEILANARNLAGA
ncbi:Lactoylglutathione lyase [Vanrija albida]|uniref:Lactoylglutathione lyase n=1 Tax=Vanrija albida TaxID=181172 RepID=A0ABR3QDF4_9TREE